MGIQINGQTDTISATDGALNIGGTVTVQVTGDATGLTGTPNITVGVVTASSAVISGDLTVNGTTTTLDTTLTEVDKLEVGANNTTVGVAITQSGSGDILRLYDGASQVVTVTDGGSVGIGTNSADNLLTIVGDHQGFVDDSDQPQATLLIKHGTTGSNRRWIGIGASTTGAWIQSSSPGGSGLAAPLSINPGGGNIGIGTDNPARKVEIFDTAATVLQLNSTNSGGTSLRIQNSGTDKMYMGLAGDFIIGQGSNVTDSAIRASGSLLFASGGGTERLRITSSGDLCLGSAVGANNDGSGISIYNENYPRISFRNSTTGNGLADGSQLYLVSDDLYITNNENADVIFRSDATERLRITSNGNVRFQADNTTSNFTIANITGTTYVLDTTTPSAVGTGGRIVFGSTYYTGGNTMGTAYIGSYKENAPNNGAEEYNHSLVFGTQSINGLGERLRIFSHGRFRHNGGAAANSGNLADGEYNRICASNSVNPSSSRTFIFSGLTSGWMTIRGGGYSNAGQSQFAVCYQLGGYMTATSSYDVVTVQQWGNNVTISTSKNAGDFRITLTNNSGTYALACNFTVESSSYGLKVAY